MQILISSAKTMCGEPRLSVTDFSTPCFLEQAKEYAMIMSTYSKEELEEMLKISTTLAEEVKEDYVNLLMPSEKQISAIDAYRGTVFQNANVEEWTEEQLLFAQHHLHTTSFLYGLLRPFDSIKTYRLEGGVKLKGRKANMFSSWKPLLTPYFVDTINKDDGNLLFLASREMLKLFDWKKIEREVNVVTPEFLIKKNGKAKAVSHYAKMCRGQMLKFIVGNFINTFEDIKKFEWGGFTYCEELSTKDNYVFLKVE